eukprot:m.119714 g.119714  ORF g.119714 m.119714 type:complete len:281 (+) comp23194_c0_seq3:3-845(+)
MVLLADAIRTNDLAAVKAAVLTSPAVVNHPFMSTWTPLMLASFKGYVEIVEFLLANGAKVDLIDKDLRTALFYACEQCHCPVANILLAHNADPNLTDGSRRTPLFFTCEGSLSLTSSKLELSRTLIAHGANINIRDTRGQTVLHISIGLREQDIFNSLLWTDNIRLDLADNAGDTPLLYALKKNKPKHAQQLIKHGADIHFVNPKNGQTALLFACAGKHVDVVRTLVQRSVDVNLGNKNVILRSFDRKYFLKGTCNSLVCGCTQHEPAHSSAPASEGCKC